MVRRITNGDHFWTGEPVVRVCVCIPTAARHLTAEANGVVGAMGRIFNVQSHQVSRRYGDELLLTVYTGEGKGHTNDEAAVWGMRWTASLWSKLQAEAEAERVKAEKKPKSMAQALDDMNSALADAGMGDAQ